MAKPHPKNVQAVLDWYQEHRPDALPTITKLFAVEDTSVDLYVGLLLQGFEAGRAFEKKHPEVTSGIGYMP